MGNINGFFLMPHPPIMIDTIGKGEEQKMLKTIDAYENIAKKIENISPKVIIIVTPHGVLFNDAISISSGTVIHGDLKKFGEENIALNATIDTDIVNQIIEVAKKELIPVQEINENTIWRNQSKYALDHGTILPLWFINKYYTDYKIVHITYGLINKIKLYRFGMLLNDIIKNSEKEAVIIASGDLSHRVNDKSPYEYSPFGKKFDDLFVNSIIKGDVESIFAFDEKMIKESGECGLRSSYILLGALDKSLFKSDIYSYEAPFGIGYATIDFEIKGEKESMYEILLENTRKKIVEKYTTQNKYVKLAIDSIAYYLLTGKYLETSDYIEESMKVIRRGTFVSIKKNEELRGCIGTILPRQNCIATEIISNAVEAAFYDPRFAPIKEDELDFLKFSVDILSELEKVEKNQLNPKVYGVVVSNDYKSGVLLPDLEGVDTIDTQLDIALKKAGIDSEDFIIQRFEVNRQK